METAVALLLVLLIPYFYVVVRIASSGYFQAKLRYHMHIMNTAIKESPNGKRERA